MIRPPTPLRPPCDLAEKAVPGVLEVLGAGVAAGASEEDEPDSLGGPGDLAQAGRAAVAEHRPVLGADQAGAVGPAELLAEEAELGGAVLVAGDRALAEGEAEGTQLVEAEPDLDVLGAGHAGVEAADLIEDGAAESGVGGDRVGRLGGEGELLPAAEQPGGLALGRGAGVGVLQLAADAADLGVGEGLDELPKPVGDGDAVAVDEGDYLAAGLLDPAVARVGDAAARARGGGGPDSCR